LFLSDLHLGARGCRADGILHFLEHNTADTIYLVGDIFDLWHPNPPVWSQAHDAVVQTILARARSGARVVYVRGNHDAAVHRHYGRHFEHIEVVEHAFHQTASGGRYLVLHGDSCDAAWQKLGMVTRLGSRFDASLRRLDIWLKYLRRNIGPRDTSRIEALLIWLNGLLHLGNGFEQRLTELARGQGQDGVICGHFHKAALHQRHGVVYANCGDWVSSMTAISEDSTGALKLLHWNAAFRAATSGDAQTSAGSAPYPAH
jgi:UDP-2,3-diacylglucosamine pyrophosphatase LpxH